MLEIVRHWLRTGEILPPAKGDNTYIGFPQIGDIEGLLMAEKLRYEGLPVTFCMGEFCRIKENING